jgi:hypothetical protein
MNVTPYLKLRATPPIFTLLPVTLIFVSALPAIAAEADRTLADIEPLTAFNDWFLLAARWLQQQAAGKH